MEQGVRTFVPQIRFEIASAGGEDHRATVFQDKQCPTVGNVGKTADDEVFVAGLIGKDV